jgi:hypothetical protein
MESNQDRIEAGAWIGRQQAFAIIATKCSASRAFALKQVRESRSFEQLGVAWEDFCEQYAGISRSQADRLIQEYDELGDAYFRLSALARISPETYRQIAPKVEGDAVEIDGQKLELTMANAPRIRALIKKLRAELRDAQTHVAEAAALDLTNLVSRVDALVQDARHLARFVPHTVSLNEVRGLIAYAIDQWKALSRELPAAPK